MTNNNMRVEYIFHDCATNSIFARSWSSHELMNSPLFYWHQRFIFNCQFDNKRIKIKWNKCKSPKNVCCFHLIFIGIFHYIQLVILCRHIEFIQRCTYTILDRSTNQKFSKEKNKQKIRTLSMEMEMEWPYLICCLVHECFTFAEYIFFGFVLFCFVFKWRSVCLFLLF